MIRLVSNNPVNHKYNTTKNQSQPSFKGGLGNLLNDGMRNLEKGGFLAEFFVIDFCGLILPRTVQAFHRNKEELGHYNYKAGAEEFLREILSGPSLILIPMTTLFAASKVLNPSAYIPVKNFKTLSEVYKNTLGEMTRNSAERPDNIDVSRNFITKVFNESFSEHKKTLGPEKVAETIKSITDDLMSVIKTDASVDSFNVDKKEVFARITENVKKLNIACGFRTNTRELSFAVNAENKITEEVQHLSEDIVNFANGTIKKLDSIFKKATASFTDTSARNQIMDKVFSVASGTRKAAVLLGIGLSSAFLYMTPKMYQLYKTYPGVDGLGEKTKQTGGHK